MHTISESMDTWRRGRGDIRWEFNLSAPESQAESLQMRDHTLTVLRILDDFAKPTSAEFTPISADGDASVLPREFVTTDAVAETFDLLPDIYRVDIELESIITCNDGLAEATIPDGASITLERREGQLDLSLSLNTDIYARKTLGWESQNVVLAGLNAPRLSSFLARLTAATKAQFVRLATEHFYASQASEHGFFELVPADCEAHVLRALQIGRCMRLSNLPADPSQYVFLEENVSVRQESLDRYWFCTTAIFHDGSTMSSVTNEYLDLNEARSRIRSLREQGLSLELR